MKKFIALFSVVLLLFSTIAVSVADAHSGRTNKDGCHTNRKTGNYHCH